MINKPLTPACLQSMKAQKCCFTEQKANKITVISFLTIFKTVSLTRYLAELRESCQPHYLSLPTFLIILLNLQPNNIPDPIGYHPSEESCVIINTAVALLKLMYWLEASILQPAHCWTTLFLPPFSMNTWHTSWPLALKSVLTLKVLSLWTISTFQLTLLVKKMCRTRMAVLKPQHFVFNWINSNY